MKKILLALCLMLPMMSQAKNTDDSKYLKGAVPEVNGVVTFSKTLDAQGKTKEQITEALGKFVNDSLVSPAIQDLRTRIVSDGKSDGTLVARVEERMIFKKKFLNLDQTRFRYQVTIAISEGQAKMDINQISYYYNEDMEGNNGTTYKAEEWISDSESLNKAGTKLYPRSGKFRRKTVDRVEAIFRSAQNALK